MSSTPKTDPRQTALGLLSSNWPTLRAKERMDALIEQTNAKGVVRAMPAEILYQLISEVGLSDATEIVQLASASQVQAFVDLSSWEKDRLDPHRVLMWLRAARGDDSEEFMRKVHGVDLEVLESMLRNYVVVHDLEEDPDVNPSNVTMESPEGKYLLEFKAEGADLAALRALMRDLYSEGPLETARLMEALRWELPSELEEVAYQFRNARLEDLGFPPADEAASVFSYVDPEKVLASLSGAKDATIANETLAVPGTGNDYVTSMLSGFTGNERDNLESELRALSNAVLVAEGASPGSPTALHDTAGLVRDTLSLGFEHLTSGHPERAPHVVETIPLKRIFQVGFSLTLKLKHHADRLFREPTAREGQTLLAFKEEQGLVAALRRNRPRRWLKVEGAEPAPFRSRRELQEAASGLARAAAQVVVFRSLLGTTRTQVDEAMSGFRAPFETVGTDRLFAAAVAQAVLDASDAKVAAVPESRLVELAQRLFDQESGMTPRLRSSAHDRAVAALEMKCPPSAREELTRMVDRTLKVFLDEWGSAFTKQGRLDPVMVGVHLPLT